MKLNLNKRYIMKKILFISCIVLVSFCVTACGNSTESLEESINNIKLESNLVSYDALYHNVIEYEKKAGPGFTHLFEKNRKMFVEYTGTIEMGIDLSKVKMTVVDNQVNVFVPKAEVIGEPDVDYSQFNEKCFIENKDGLINKNPITLDDSSNAFQKAQNNMKQFALSDKNILNQVQVRAQLILEEMIKNIVPIDESKYSINWELEK